MTTREEFEAWISAPPYEKSVTRFAEGSDIEHAWPGQYDDYAVQLAWEAWEEAHSRIAAQVGEMEKALREVLPHVWASEYLNVRSFSTAHNYDYLSIRLRDYQTAWMNGRNRDAK